MTTTLAITFPWGRYHATPWGRHVNEAVPEWPPSPWRILRALFATWKARAPYLEEDIVLRALSRLVDPPAFVLPPAGEAHTRHFMPDAGYGPAGPGKNRDKVFDTFTVFEPGSGVLVDWPVDLRGDERSALADLAARLPYLGRAEAVCEASLVDDPPPDGLRTEPVAGARGLARPPVRVLCPQAPLDQQALTIRTHEVRAMGLLDPPGARWIDYVRPEGPMRRSRRSRPRRLLPTVVKWAMSSPALPSVRAAVTMADSLRTACMSRFGTRFEGATSETLVGKDPSGRPLQGHRHAHYLAVDEDGDGLLDHLILWAPGGLGDHELDALGNLTRLTGPRFAADFRPVRLGLEALGSVEQMAPGLIGPARRWRSHTPFAPPRHPKRRLSWEAFVHAEVRRELSSRGFPDPHEVNLIRGDWLTFRRNRAPREPLEASRPAVGAEIVFPDSVRGPIALGALSHFGLGLFLPVDGT